MVRGDRNHEERIEKSHRRRLPLVDGATLRIARDDIDRDCERGAPILCSSPQYHVDNRSGPVRGSFHSRRK